MRYIGKEFPVHDAYAKATGRAVYAGDMQLHRMLHGAMVFSPIPHGLVRAVHVEKALASPGVEAILHCFNTTEKTFNRYRSMKGQPVVDQERVFNQHVRFVGDRVACVLADTPAHARQAARLLQVEYEALPHTYNMQQALNGGFDTIHDGGAATEEFFLEVGDAAQVAADAVEITTSARLSRISHVAMEPHACVAAYDKGTGQLTIHSPCQSVFGIRTVVADLFDLPYDAVRVIKTTMGGSFGCKQEWVLEPVAACAALHTGRPVKLVYERGDVMRSTVSRCPLDSTLTSKFTKEGKLQAFDAEVTVDAGAYLGNSQDYSRAIANKFFRVYKYPYMRYRSRAVCTNTPVSGAFRGWTAPETCIMLEHNFNMAARRLGMDPIDLRLRNVALPGDVDIRLEQPLGEIRIKECLELGRDKFRWEEKRLENARFNAKNPRYKRGVGVACGGHLNGYFPRLQDFTGIEMRMNEGGTVQVLATIHDHGCGAVRAFQMIIAEELGLGLEQVRMGEGDTAYTPFDVGCFSSRSIYAIGRAAKDCAALLKECIRAGIAEIHGCSMDEIEMEDGCVCSRTDASIHYTYGQAATAMLRTLQRETWVAYQYRNPSNPGVTGAHFSQVEVDTYTGLVRVLDYLAVHDIGQAINRALCVGQVQGAAVMGIGAALSESMEPHPISGRLPRGLQDYHVITAVDAPDIQVEFIEDGSADGPYGAKSIGEIAYVPTAPCIIGAVNDALGSELNSLPLDPDTILAFLAEKEARP